MGPLRLEGIPEPLFPTRRSKALLLRLAMDVGRPVTRNELSRLLWPDDYLDASRPRLRQEVARLKKALGPFADNLLGDREALMLESGVQVDLSQWQEDVGIPPSALAPEREARLLSYLPEAFATGFEEDWIVEARAKMTRRHAAALLRVADWHLDRKRPEQALPFAERVVSLTPQDEEGHLRLLRVLSAQGRVLEVRSRYRDIEQHFLHTLGVRPSPMLRDLARVATEVPMLGASRLTIRRPATPLTPMIGRDRDLAAAVRWLEEGTSRLLTLHGAGGIGKTRLAQEIHQIAFNYLSGRVWWIELADVLDPKRIGPSILDSLHLRSTGEDPLEVIRASLGDEPALIILDNFEQVVDEGAHFVRRLLRENPGVRVMITSRRKLLLAGETAHTLGPLTGNGEESAAVRLFRQLVPGGERLDLEPIQVLVTALDGNPLAIELAAGRSAVFTVEQLAEIIPNELDLLESRSSIDPRHRHLRATIRWSYDLLPPHLREFLIGLTAFHGGWLLEDAVAVLDEPNAAEYLQELVEHSFIHADNSPDGVRFRLLVTIRTFLGEQIPIEKRRSLTIRMAKALAEAAPELGRSLLREGALASLRRIELRHEDFMTSMQWAVENDRKTAVEYLCWFWRYWSVRGNVNDALQWCDFALDPSHEPTEELAYARFGLARCAIEASEFDLAIKLYEACKELFLRHKWNVTMLRSNIGDLLVRKGEYGPAAELLERCLEELLSKVGTGASAYDVMLTRTDLGHAYTFLGQLDLAAENFHEAEAFLRNHKDKVSYASTLNQMGDFWLASGASEAAQQSFEDARRIFSNFGKQAGVGLTECGLARICNRRSQWEEALIHVQAALDSFNQVPDRWGMAWAESARSEALNGLGRPAESAIAMRRAQHFFAQIGNETEAGRCAAAIREMAAPRH